jgi:hypothetical protein
MPSCAPPYTGGSVGQPANVNGSAHAFLLAGVLLFVAFGSAAWQLNRPASSGSGGGGVVGFCSTGFVAADGGAG